MKATKSIWLSEYEGLLPTPKRGSEPSRGPAAEMRPTPDQEIVGPHIELGPIHLTRTTPTAFFE